MTQIVRTAIRDWILAEVDEFADDCEIPRGEALNFLLACAIIQKNDEIAAKMAADDETVED